MASIAITAAATALAAAGSAVEARQQGVATDKMDRQKARVEQINETQKQKALASQNADTLGAVATGRATGFGANALRQINQAQNDLMVSNANSSAQVSLLDQAGTNASDAGSITAATDLASGAAKTASLYPKQGN
jgi:GTP cyclohydrolase II